jgi:hypothetical protein
MPQFKIEVPTSLTENEIQLCWRTTPIHICFSFQLVDEKIIFGYVNDGSPTQLHLVPPRDFSPFYNSDSPLVEVVRFPANSRPLEITVDVTKDFSHLKEETIDEAQIQSITMRSAESHTAPNYLIGPITNPTEVPLYSGDPLPVPILCELRDNILRILPNGTERKPHFRPYFRESEAIEDGTNLVAVCYRFDRNRQKQPALVDINQTWTMGEVYTKVVGDFPGAIVWAVGLVGRARVCAGDDGNRLESVFPRVICGWREESFQPNDFYLKVRRYRE